MFFKRAKELDEQTTTSRNSKNKRNDKENNQIPLARNVLNLLDGSVDITDEHEEFVTIPDCIGDEFVIIENSQKGVKTKKTIRRTLTTIFILILCIFGLFLSLFKIISEDVKGSFYNFSIGETAYSIISKSHQSNVDELKSGDVFFIDNSGDFSPVSFNYNVYTYKNRNGAIIYAFDQNGKIEKIQSMNVDYIRKSKEVRQ